MYGSNLHNTVHEHSLTQFPYPRKPRETWRSQTHATGHRVCVCVCVCVCVREERGKEWE